MKTPDNNMDKVVKKPKVKKVKKPKFKLVTYTIKAIIPTGMYANIQPEVVVEADTLENAERAVMPHIEALFAKYRENGPMTVNVIQKPITPAPVAPVLPPQDKKNNIQNVSAKVAPTVEVQPIVFTVPFSRAKAAIESATSIEAIGLIEDQIVKSTKLIATEKQDLSRLILLKRKELNTLKNNG